MSIGGLGGVFPDPKPPRPGESADEARGGGEPPAHGHGLPMPDAPPPGGAAGAPASTEGDLWGLLSGEERAYYLRNSITSAATYDVRRGGAPSSPAGSGTRLGGRLDVRA